MDVPADQSTAKSSLWVRVPTRIIRSPRRRRPTGEPPPLPYHLQTSGIGWLIAGVVLIVLSVVVFADGLRGPAVAVTVADDAVVRWLAGLVGPGLVAPLRGLARIASWWVLYTLYFGLLLVLLVLRRWRHLLLWLVIVQLGAFLTVGLATFARRPRPFGVDLQASWGGWALPSLQVAFLTVILMGVLYTLVPEGRWRNRGKWVAAALVAVVVTARMALGVDAPSDVLVGVAIGVTLPLLAFRRFAPNEAFPVSYRRGRTAHLDISGARGQAIRRALEDQLGVVALEVEPFGQLYSASSTPLRIKAQGDPQAIYLFAKLYAQSHLRADRWYKLGRELLYGRLEDEKPFNSVRRLVAHEDYALRLLRDAGLPVPKPLGSVELNPEREYLLVTEFLEGAKEISEVEVDDTIIDEGLRIVRGLWNAGLAHRDIKPANLLVQDGHVRLIDTLLTEVHASPWRQAVDLANMMLVLALGASPERVYQRALHQFTVDDITEALAVRQGRAMPSQVRELLSGQAADLHAEFIRLLPSPPRPVRLQRWTARRLGLWAAMVLPLALAALNSSVFFTNEDAVETPLNITNLGCSHPEPLWLMAQSVPSASLVPCMRGLPAGWSVAGVAVNDGRSVITLHNDRAGPRAAVARLTAACDTTGAAAVPASQPGTHRYTRVERRTDEFSTTVYDQFPGGCVTYRLHSRSDLKGGFASELPLLFRFTSRQALRQALEERSGGRLHLDPGAAP
jgi:tRNA A-37 threonylcarbamoyl transferase component Bud32/membrane-associated phospholipid phosphatase